MLYFLAGTTFLSAFGILVSKNVFNAALLLIACLISVAGLYLLLQAEFLAVTQIIMYAGGVVVLIVFGIMLTVRRSGGALLVSHRNVWLGGLVASAWLGVLWMAMGDSPLPPITQPVAMGDHFNQVGVALFTIYTAPFELAGVLLLISLIAAAVMASQVSERENA